MAQPYLTALEDLVARELPGTPGLVCKHFFSGAALYSNSSICASLTPVGIAFKLSECRCSALIASGRALPLRYFAMSPVKKGYVLFPNASSLAAAEVASHFRECVSHANAPDA